MRLHILVVLFVCVASGSHAYRVEFVNAMPTAPLADSAQSDAGHAVPMSHVTYHNLWAGSGSDTITFSVSGTIALGSQLPAIPFSKTLTIDGARQNVTISGTNAVLVFTV